MFYDITLFENVDWYKVQFLKKCMSLRNFWLVVVFKLSDLQGFFFLSHRNEHTENKGFCPVLSEPYQGEKNILR